MVGGRRPLQGSEAISSSACAAEEIVARHWWDRLLYNQSAKRLKSALVGREHTVIADVPYRRGH
jgi:hypothetical protein